MSAEKAEDEMRAESNPLDEIEIVTVGKPEPAAPPPPSATPAKPEQPEPEDGQDEGEEEDAIREEPQVLVSRPSMSQLGLGESHGEKRVREHVESMLSQKHIEESQNDRSEEEDEDDDKSESGASKSQAIAPPKSPQDSGDERREEVPTSRKCFNKLCSSKKIYKKIRSKVEENKYRFFCRTCYENYYNSRYCQFCEQVYSNTGENEDDDNWIGCDHCERWNHIECERRYRNCNVRELRDKDLLYECLICSQKSKLAQDKAKREPRDHGEAYQPGKQKVEINRDQRTPIFHKKNESFPNLEYFLQTYSFRLWINEGQIREDIESLRSTCLRQPQEENYGKNKYKKIKTAE